MRSSSYVSFLYTAYLYTAYPLTPLKQERRIPVFPFLANKLAYKKCLTTPFLQSEENERDWDEEVKKRRGRFLFPFLACRRGLLSETLLRTIRKITYILESAVKSGVNRGHREVARRLVIPLEFDMAIQIQDVHASGNVAELGDVR